MMLLIFCKAKKPFGHGEWKKPVKTGIALVTVTLIALSYIAVEQGRAPFLPPNAISHAVRSFSPSKWNSTHISSSSTVQVAHAPVTPLDELGMVLAEASMPNRTVIVTTVNKAWMEPNGMVDLFLESFRIGEGTRGLLNNLLIVALDESAFNRCKEIHPHCYDLRTPGVDFSAQKDFMTEDYLKMTHNKILFLQNILERGYSFIFSDADVLWFRNPFQRLSAEADVQTSCDAYNGKSDDASNAPNTGFMFVRSNHRAIEFYRLWRASTDLYPGEHDQNVLNNIKFSANFTQIGLKLVFLDTTYFSGFCEMGKGLGAVCTVHANCCIGLNSKVRDLRAALEDWVLFQSFDPHLPLESRRRGEVQWRGPNECHHSIAE